MAYALLGEARVPRNSAVPFPACYCWQVISGTRTTGTSIRSFTSALSGDSFTHLGKSGSTDVDLMEDVIQAHYKVRRAAMAGVRLCTALCKAPPPPRADPVLLGDLAQARACSACDR